MTDWTKDLYTLRYHWQWAGLLVALMVGGPLLLARLAWPTTVLEKSFSSLVRDAEVIAVGTVTAIDTEWDAEKDAPFTLVTFSDLEVLKGYAGQTEITLHFLGGPTPDGLVMQIAGVPQFSLEERAVLFIRGNQHHAVPLVGMWQGVYRVVFDDERGVDTIHNHAGQPVTALPTEDGGILHDAAPLVREQEKASSTPQEAMSLEAFTQRIEREVLDEQ
ncbi:MAG: hypothetical protein OXC18_07650 [Desulfurellaceae bacterium]|nr:hypothetical protein [Desulfurellaceae bacterium]